MWFSTGTELSGFSVSFVRVIVLSFVHIHDLKLTDACHIQLFAVVLI